MVSYDLWEEKFAVDRQGTRRQFSSHMSAAAAENYCFANLSLGTGALSRERDFWLRLEVHVEDPREKPPAAGQPVPEPQQPD